MRTLPAFQSATSTATAFCVWQGNKHHLSIISIPLHECGCCVQSISQTSGKRTEWRCGIFCLF